MKTKQKNIRMRLPYYEALKGLDGTAIIHDALDNSKHQGFRKELTKQQEAYDNIQEEHNETEEEQHNTITQDTVHS